MQITSIPAAFAALAALAGPSVAADLRPLAPPLLVPPPPFTWTGAYVGVGVGSAQAEDRPIRTFGNNGAGVGALIAPGNTNTVAEILAGRRPGRVATQADSFTVGGVLGYNFQLTPGAGFVVGGEVDAQYVDLNRDADSTSSLGAVSQFRQGIDMLATVRARLGYAFDNILIYGTGGFAYGTVNQQTRFFGAGAGRPLSYFGGYNDLTTGFAYGGGVEFAFPAAKFLSLLGTSAVTIRGEYIRYDLGTRDVLVNSVNPATGLPLTAATGSFTSRFATEGTLIRGVLSYKFGL